jgi:hypothetical protein
MSAGGTPLLELTMPRSRTILLLVPAVFVVLAAALVVRGVLQTRSEAALRARLRSLPQVPATLNTPGPGSFESSDRLLNRIWASSVGTATSMLAPGGLQKDALGRNCKISLRVVVLDGWIRDRCPYVGDEHVIALTFDASRPRFDVQRDMLAWFARAQQPDGAIPASPIFGGTLVLFDYNAYWIQSLYAYALHSGDLAFVRRVWPNLRRLMRWYSAHTLADGLLENDLGSRDYAFIERRGKVVAYYNAQYVLALQEAVKLAKWTKAAADASRWSQRESAARDAFTAAFWDRGAGAFRDTTEDSTTHPQDGNAFAILAGLATPAQARSALLHLTSWNARFYGNTFSDSTVWDGHSWGSDADQRVYPFISYFEVTARFEQGMDESALELIRREWGYMLTHGPKSTMWETIGPRGGPPVDRVPSWDAGWSSGAAPALSEYVLGVKPLSPGFATFSLAPHAGDLEWARGDVPTPHGPIHVAWKRDKGRLVIQVRAPPGTRCITCGPAAQRTERGKANSVSVRSPAQVRAGRLRSDSSTSSSRTRSSRQAPR